MKIIILASDIFSITGIKALIEHNYNIVAIITTIDAVACNIIEKTALRYGVPFHKVKDINSDESFSTINSYEPDIIFTCNFHKILSYNTFSVAKKYAINIHPSLLPKYKGLHPIQEVLLNGEKETGITLHFISEEVDEGDIISQMKIPIDDNDYIYDLNVKLINSYPEFIVNSFNNLLNLNYNNIKPLPIQHNYIKFNKDSHLILETDSVAAAMNKIKAFSYPYKGARYKNLIIWKAFYSCDHLKDEYIEIKLFDGSLFIPKEFYELKEKHNEYTSPQLSNNGGGIVYNNYLLNIFIDIINSNGVAFETNIYEYSIDVDNFDIGFYAYDAIILCKLMDNYIKCFYYGQNIENIVNALNLISTLPYNFDYILEIQYKSINIFDKVVSNCFNKIGSLIKLYRKKTQLIEEYIIPNEIEYAMIDDVDEILHIQHSIFDKYVERYLTKEDILNRVINKNIIVYKLNNILIGFMIFHYNGKNCYFDYLAVKNEYKGIGIGTSIFKAAIKLNFNNTINLWVRHNNKAINIYKLCDFMETNLKSDIYIYKK